MVSYLRSPGGHCGSSLSSTSGKPAPGIVGVGGAPLPSKFLSKNVKSNSALTADANPTEFALLLSSGVLTGLLDLKGDMRATEEAWELIRVGIETVTADDEKDAGAIGDKRCVSHG